MLKSKTVFNTAPLCWLSAQRWESQSLGLPFLRKMQARVIQAHSSAALGLSAFGLVPLHPTDSALRLSVTGHWPLKFQGVIMSSSLGYQPSSFQCLITLGNISFECTDSEFSVKSELATSYQQCHNEDISSKIPEQVLEKPERDTQGDPSALPLAQSPRSMYGCLLGQGSIWSSYWMRTPLVRSPLKQMSLASFSLELQDRWHKINTRDSFWRTYQEFYPLFFPLRHFYHFPNQKYGS